jgi:hypothetical protein
MMSDEFSPVEWIFRNYTLSGETLTTETAVSQRTPKKKALCG